MVKEQMKIDLLTIEKILDWIKTKLKLNENAINTQNRIVKRGQVYRCNFGVGIGSEMQKERPAVIIQNDIGNNRSGNTIVIPITHNISDLPCVHTITTQTGSNGEIILDGQANASNMMCISKARLGNYICTLSTEDMKGIDEAVAKTLALMKYYAELSKKIESRDAYISKIKVERNKAQDELAEIRDVLNIQAEDSIKESIKKIVNNLDRQEGV